MIKGSGGSSHDTNPDIRLEVKGKTIPLGLPAWTGP